MKIYSAFTLIEMLVVISIIAVIAALAVPTIGNALTRGQLLQAVSNARQVYIATQTMATDGAQTGDPRYGWPGDLAESTDDTAKIVNVSDFVMRLVDNDYLKAGDLKVFATTGMTPWSGTYAAPTGDTGRGTLTPAFDAAKNNAFKIYKVKDRHGGDTIFLATKNFSYSDNRETAINEKATPFGDKGFVIFRKGGDGSFYKKQQATSKQLLGQPPSEAESGGAPPNESADSYLPQQ